MKRRSICILLFALFSLVQLQAQTKFTKKDWRRFTKKFHQNIKAAENFYQGYVDTENRDPLRGMPHVTIPLTKASEHYFDAAGYTVVYLYNFDSEELALNFVAKAAKKLEKKLLKNFTMDVDKDYLSIAYKENSEEHPSISISQKENQVTIYFNPSSYLPDQWKNEK